MPKSEIVEKTLRQVWICVSIIILLVIENLLLVGKAIAYMIWVLSFIWLMKRIWSNEVIIAPRGKVELWYGKVVPRLVKIVIL